MAVLEVPWGVGYDAVVLAVIVVVVYFGNGQCASLLSRQRMADTAEAADVDTVLLDPGLLDVSLMGDKCIVKADSWRMQRR